MENKYDIDLGATVYDANKQLVKQIEKKLNHLELAARQSNLEKYFETNLDKGKKYHMLLCHERRDYTVFNLDEKSLTSPMTAANEAIGCCTDRGDILSIEKTDDGIAYEIWINIDDDPFCFYLFPYDDAIIECR